MTKAPGRSTSSSKKLRTLSTLSTPLGRKDTSRVLSLKEIRQSVAQSQSLRPPGSLVHLSENDTPDYDHRLDDYAVESDRLNNVNDILEGQNVLDISHAGGEFQHILQDCLKEEASQHRTQDPRTRRDRTQRRNDAFSQQMEGIVEAYIHWTYRGGEEGLDQRPTSLLEGEIEGCMGLQIMDIFHPNVASAVLRHGLVPMAPLKPHLAVSIRALELYRVTHLRSPHLTVEPFVKSLCDLHRLPYRQYLAQQFSIAFDLYLDIRHRVLQKVYVVLGRNTPQWRLRNACSACTYKLENEGDLIFKMLFTMDGNDSLKRLRGATIIMPSEDGDEPQIGESHARDDLRTIEGDRYLTRAEVDRWAKTQLEEILFEKDEENPCAGRWNNMINEVTAKMWGIFDETGVFLALCRHGYTLVITDMVQSGELLRSKYPLAVVKRLLDVFGEDIGGGYDIGCKFSTTVNKSELGEQAQRLRFKALVGSFHGHAHNRICQLSNLATYVRGMGLEDLEGCERFFSKSNTLAASIRYATVFHRQQKIVEYMAHMDSFETSHTLSKFLVDNYRQALHLLAGEDALQKTMQDQGIAGTHIFHEWLEEERTYLKSLASEPIEETTEMDYYQKLVNYYAACTKLYKLRTTWIPFDPHVPAPSNTKRKKNPETVVIHAQEAVDIALEHVQQLEIVLGITKRWTDADDEWKAAAIRVKRRRYQRCLDELESLVVSRMFELTKMNMSQTGYKMQKHIAQALKARSQAIKNALERYNDAAATLTPPKSPLQWNEVVEYAFLADFDLLRECRQDIRERPWARPAARLAMDQYFRMERAREEIQRLNIEIRRVVTHMRDEETFLQMKERELQDSDAVLAYQISRYREERTRFYDLHRRRFKKLSSHPRFSGNLEPGVPKDKTLLLMLPGDTEDQDVDMNNNDEDGEEDGDDDGLEDRQKDITEALQVMFIHG
ncbi:hypothetical protein H0H92_000527 [Tricholoma furcatifolium]|nr:hypothetical protein H0H92_000527 [Tricholoma furcatifolium]